MLIVAQITPSVLPIPLDGSGKQERQAVSDKPARRLQKVCTVYVRAVGL